VAITEVRTRQTESNALPRLALPPLRNLHGRKAKIGAHDLVSLRYNNKQHQNLPIYTVTTVESSSTANTADRESPIKSFMFNECLLHYHRDVILKT